MTKTTQFACRLWSHFREEQFELRSWRSLSRASSSCAWDLAVTWDILCVPYLGIMRWWTLCNGCHCHKLHLIAKSWTSIMERTMAIVQLPWLLFSYSHSWLVCSGTMVAIKLPWLVFNYHGWCNHSDCLVSLAVPLLWLMCTGQLLFCCHNHSCHGYYSISWVHIVTILVPCKDESIQVVITVCV